MKNKIIIIFSLIFILLVAIGTVSAEDINSTDVSSSDVLEVSIDENIGVDDSTDNLSITNSNEAIGASEIYVNGSVATSGDGSKDNPFKTLKEAIDASSNGDTICIASGTYAGSDNVRLSIEKEIKLTNYGDEPVIFDGQKSSSILSILADNVEIRGITFNNSDGMEGSALRWKGAMGTLFNCTFINSTVNDGRGGAVFWNSANGTLFDCTFINSTVNDDRGGAVFWNSANGTLFDCTFINSTSKGEHGGAVFWNSVNGTLFNCTFINSTVNDGRGGAVYWDNTVGTLFNCTFINSTVNDGWGGAVYWNSDGGVLANCTFINPNADKKGGAVYWVGANGALFNSTFINAAADIEGGAVYWFGGNAVLFNCTFMNSTAGGSGGAVFWDANDGVLANCTFIDSHSLYDGGNGGAVCWHGIKGVLSNSTFINSTSNKGLGGAVCWIHNKGVLANSSFINSTAGFAGGAVGLLYTNVILANSSFTNSSANFGGAVSFEGGSSILTNCAFTNSNASKGGAVRCYGGDDNILSSIFINNQATDFANVIYLMDGNLTAKDNIFIDSYGTDYDISVDENGTFVGDYNWFADAYDNRTVGPKINGSTISKWLYLNSTSSSNALAAGDNATVTFSLNNYYDNSTKSVGYYDASNVPLYLGVSSTGGYTNVTTVDFIKGNASVLYTASEQDNYSLTVSIGSFSLTQNFGVAIVIYAPALVKYYDGLENFNVTITAGGVAVEGQSVSITINNMTYDRTTDENGKVYLYVDLSPGYYPVFIQAGDEFTNSSVTVLTTVNGTGVVKTYKNSTQYWATFRDCFGHYAPVGLTVQFNINGVLYDRDVVAENGLAKLNINLNPGTYIITAINPLTGEQSSNNITVLAQIIDNVDLVKYYKNDSQYVVKVTGVDGNVVGAGEKVVFNINGILYERYTNETGHAKLNINLGPGNYVITAMYNSSMSSNNITVLPTVITSDLTKKYGTPDPFTAKVVDKTGKILSNVDVYFNVNGIIYTRPTDVNGTARLNINLIPGKYIITSTYDDFSTGNNITVLS